VNVKKAILTITIKIATKKEKGKAIPVTGCGGP
jgi:hypothetical protein